MPDLPVGHPRAVPRAGGSRSTSRSLQLSPPDRHGLCTLGTSVDAARAAADHARADHRRDQRADAAHARRNDVVPLSRVDAFIAHRAGRCTSIAARPRPPVEARIGELIAGLVEDGATLQMGIGAIPDAVLRRLGNKHDLGVHTEMFSDGLVDAARRRRDHQPAQGGAPGPHRHLVRERHAAPVRLRRRQPAGRVPPLRSHQRHGARSARTRGSTAINSALEIDLTGQVCADSIGHAIFSGIGGQMDFIRGAARSAGGKPIIALPSTAAAARCRASCRR